MPETALDPELARVERDIDQVHAALRSPTVGLFTSRRLYRRLESLYRELDTILERGCAPNLDD